MNDKLQAILLGATLATTLGAHAGMRELSFMTATPIAEPVALDGALSEECWRSGVPNRSYYRHLDAKGTHYTNLQTSCTILYDDRGIYVGVVNHDPEIGLIKRDVQKDNDPDMWRDDCAEIYFDPAANGVGFYKFVVNANGKCDSLWRMDAANIHNDWRAPGVASAAKIFGDRWELELFVPWPAFGLRGRPDAGSFWTFNHSRFRWRRSQLCSSAPCAGHTQPQRFGTLYFSGGTPPSPEGILAMLEKRQQPDWGIQIGGTTYLHTLSGTRPIEGSLPDLIARKEAEEKAAEKRCEELAEVLVAGTGTVSRLDLPLAGTYDFDPPEAYDGYDGWYRHNADPSVAGPHLDWAPRTTDRPRVLFLTGLGGAMRDAVELSARFAMDADIVPAVFDLSGIWEDCVKGGTYVDKCRQFESLLARDPDVVVLTEGRLWPKIPARYRLEILRRVREEGVGLVTTGWEMKNLLDRGAFGKLPRDRAGRDLLAQSAPFAEIRGFALPAPRGSGGATKGLLESVVLGKGRIIHADTISGRKWDTSDPDWINRWPTAFETRYVHYFDLIRAAQRRDAKIAFSFERPGDERTEADGRSLFLPVGVSVRGTGLRGASLRLRLRDRWNAVVRDEVRDLSKGEQGVLFPLSGLPGGEYVLDLIASVGGEVEAVAFRPLTVASPCGDLAIARGATNRADRVVAKTKAVPVTWTEPLDEPLLCKVSLRTLPHGELVWTNTYAVARRATGIPRVLLRNETVPTLAGVLGAELYTTNGRKIADARRTFFFPDHDFPAYTRIMWDNLACGGDLLMPLLAPSVVESFGYDNHLGEGGFGSALFNGRAVPYIAHVSLQRAENGGVSWSTWGHTMGWGKEQDALREEFEGTKAKEINPYDPRVREALERFFVPKVRKAAPYGVCVWNLGDENGYDYEAGDGPRDKAPFARFLEEKYGTIARFNEVHGTKADSFGTAPHLVKSEAIRAKDWPAYFDHVQYIDRMYSDFHQTLAEIIRRYDPGARIGAEGSNPGELEQTVGKLGFWGPYRNLVTDELLRNIGGDRVRGTWWGGYFDNLRDGFPVQQWEYLLTGTVNADQWFALTPGDSQGACGGDFKFAPYVERMLPHLKLVSQGMAQSFQETPFRDDGFAIYYSYPSTHAALLDEAFPPPDDSIASLVRFCYRTGYGVKMITGRTIAKLAGTKVLFLCGASALADAEVAAIRDWTAKGGLLVADCEPGVLDGFLAKRAEGPLKGLWRPFRADDGDEALQAILSEKGIANRESISGLPAASCVFRVREKDGMRLVGFKCVKKDLGSKVVIDLGEAGTVYEFGSGRSLGRLDKIEIPSLDVPFKCYAVYRDPPAPPDPAKLVPGRVYRLMAFDAKGREIVHRTKVFVAEKGRDPTKDLFIPLDEAPGVTYRLVDVNTGLSGDLRP